MNNELLYEKLHENFLLARNQGGGGGDAFYNIGPFRIRVCFANRHHSLAFSPALEHVRINDQGSADLTVCVWDSVSTGTRIPFPDIDECLRSAPHEIVYRHDGHIRSAFQMGFNTFSLLDSESRKGLFWIRDISDTPFYERCSPFKMIINWWMMDQGLQAVHSAAVGNESGGVLITGKGGSGKSTTALCAMLAGMTYLGDDFCLLSRKPYPYVYSLYSSAKLEENNLHRLPALSPYVEHAQFLESRKSMCFLYPAYRDRLKKGFPLRAILVATVSGEEHTRVVPLHPARTLRAVAPSTVLQLPGNGVEAFRFLAELVKEVPNYLLLLGTRTEQIPEAIETLLLQSEEPTDRTGEEVNG